MNNPGEQEVTWKARFGQNSPECVDLDEAEFAGLTRLKPILAKYLGHELVEQFSTPIIMILLVIPSFRLIQRNAPITGRSFTQLVEHQTCTHRR